MSGEGRVDEVVGVRGEGLAWNGSSPVRRKGLAEGIQHEDYRCSFDGYRNGYDG